MSKKKNDLEYGPAIHRVRLRNDRRMMQLTVNMGKKEGLGKTGKPLYIMQQVEFPRLPGETDAKARLRGENEIVRLQDLARTPAGELAAPRRVVEAVEYYFTTPHWKRLANGTRKRDQTHIKAFLRWASSRNITHIKELTLGLVNEYQLWYLREHAKVRRFAGPEEPKEEFRRAVNNNMSAVRNVFTEEMGRGASRQLEANPFRPSSIKWDGIAGVVKLNHPRNTKRAFTKYEWDLFILHLPTEELRHIFCILYYSLMRSTELRIMQQSWISSDLKTIRIPYYVTKTGLTTGKDSVLNCHPDLAEHLQFFLDKNKGKKYLIRGSEIVPSNYFLDSLRTACALLEKKYPGMDFSKVDVHSVRRTGATLWHQAGGKVADISRQLCHTSIATTYLYLGLSDDSMVIEGLKLMPKARISNVINTAAA